MSNKIKQAEATGVKKSDNAAPATSDEDVKSRTNMITLAQELKNKISDEEEMFKRTQTRKAELLPLWNASKEKLVEMRHHCDSTTADVSLLEFEQTEKINKWKREIREIMNENQQAVAAERSTSDATLSSSKLQKNNEISQCKNDINFIKYLKREKESCHCELVRRLKEHEGQLKLDLSTEFQLKRKELIEKANQELKQIQEEFEEKIKYEVHLIEEGKDADLGYLLTLSEEEIQEIVAHYKKLIDNNFDQLKSLQDQEVEARRKGREESLILSNVKKEHAKRAEPMLSFQSEATIFSNYLGSEEKEKQALIQARAHLSDLNACHDDLKWRHELLLQNLLLIQKRHDTYKTHSMSSIYESQRQSELCNFALEKTLLGLLERGEQQTATLSNVLIRGNFDPDSVRKIQSQITNVLQMKTDQIIDLEKKMSDAKKFKGNLERVVAEALNGMKA